MELEKILRIDKLGRIVVPAWIRKRLRAKRFAISFEEKGQSIVLKPVKSIDEWFGTMPGIMKGFKREHKEVQREHSY